MEARKDKIKVNTRAVADTLLEEADANWKEANAKLKEATELLKSKEEVIAKFYEEVAGAAATKQKAEKKQHTAELESTRLQDALDSQKKWYEATHIAVPARVLGADIDNYKGRPKHPFRHGLSPSP